MKKKAILLFLIGLLNLCLGCSDKSELRLIDTRDTLSYKIVNHDKSFGPCEDKLKNCAEINISFPQFHSEANDSVIVSVNNFIKEAILYYYYGETAPLSIEELMNQFVEDYQDFLLESPDYDVAWKQTNNIKVLMNQSGILCLELFDYHFMGGAHPNTVVAYENINTRTGEKIYLSDLFKTNYEKALDAIGEKEFRAIHNIPDNAIYDTLGFWFDNNKFVLTDNFAIGITGLVFLYNSYEIAPYSTGRTKLEIPYAELESIINPEGLLGKIITAD